MIKDNLMLNPMWFGDDISVTSPLNVIESVPVSQYKSYLEATYGDGILAGEDSQTADLFFNAATAYSTDESLSEIINDQGLSPGEKAKHYIARWLHLGVPIVDAATALRKTSTAKLARYDNGKIPLRYDQEMEYVVGIFYASTQIASAALDIPHPSETHSGLLLARSSRGRPVEQRVSERSAVIELSRAATVPQNQRQQVDVLASKTVVLNARAMKAAEKTIALFQATQARQELMTILDE